MRVSFLVMVGLAASAAVASAQPAPPPPEGYRLAVPAPARPERSLSLTISPLHLLLPLLEVTAEYRVGPRLGVAGVGGIGAITATTSADDSVRFFATEVGASVRYYVTGSFQRGVQVGAEALYLYLKIDESSTSVDITGAGDGLSIGPFLGYKWIGRSGFTFDAQGGLAYAATRSSASDGTTSATASDNRLYPLLNVNVGWSF